MINTLFLGAGETRTINAMRYNVVAKSLFPCSIRVKDKFGVERDRFDNVTSGFSFELDDQGVYRLEISNGIYAQDVKIYSGVFEVKNVNEFENFYEKFFYASGVSSNYCYISVNNTSKRSINIKFSPLNNDLLRVKYNISSYGTESSTTYFTDKLDNNINNIPIIIGYHSVIPSQNSCTLVGYTRENTRNLNLPSNLRLFLHFPSVSSALNLNLKCSI